MYALSDGEIFSKNYAHGRRPTDEAAAHLRPVPEGEPAHGGRLFLRGEESEHPERRLHRDDDAAASTEVQIFATQTKRCDDHGLDGEGAAGEPLDQACASEFNVGVHPQCRKYDHRALQAEEGVDQRG